ncbi:hypothetical protein NL676_007175 [Syzygium grande]|nr:hypothetical protein NL676_007175 [Syzygium grande]
MKKCHETEKDRGEFPSPSSCFILNHNKEALSLPLPDVDVADLRRFAAVLHVPAMCTSCCVPAAFTSRGAVADPFLLETTRPLPF